MVAHPHPGSQVLESGEGFTDINTYVGLQELLSYIVWVAIYFKILQECISSVMSKEKKLILIKIQGWLIIKWSIFICSNIWGLAN